VFGVIATAAPAARRLAGRTGISVGAVVMRNIFWLVLIGLIGLGLVVAIKIGTSAPAGADVDEAKVGTAAEHDSQPKQTAHGLGNSSSPLLSEAG
jgi:hypothetical protein